MKVIHWIWKTCITKNKLKTSATSYCQNLKLNSHGNHLIGYKWFINTYLIVITKYDRDKNNIGYFDVDNWVEKPLRHTYFCPI